MSSTGIPAAIIALTHYNKFIGEGITIWGGISGCDLYCLIITFVISFNCVFKIKKMFTEAHLLAEIFKGEAFIKAGFRN